MMNTVVTMTFPPPWQVRDDRRKGSYIFEEIESPANSTIDQASRSRRALPSIEEPASKRSCFQSRTDDFQQLNNEISSLSQMVRLHNAREASSEPPAKQGSVSSEMSDVSNCKLPESRRGSTNAEITMSKESVSAFYGIQQQLVEQAEQLRELKNRVVELKNQLSIMPELSIPQDNGHHIDPVGIVANPFRVPSVPHSKWSERYPPSNVFKRTTCMERRVSPRTVWPFQTLNESPFSSRYSDSPFSSRVASEWRGERQASAVTPSMMDMVERFGEKFGERFVEKFGEKFGDLAGQSPRPFVFKGASSSFKASPFKTKSQPPSLASSTHSTVCSTPSVSSSNPSSGKRLWIPIEDATESVQTPEASRIQKEVDAHLPQILQGNTAGLPAGVWFDRVENRYVVQCNETTSCGRKKRKYFGISRYGFRAKFLAIAARLAVLGLIPDDADHAAVSRAVAKAVAGALAGASRKGESECSPPVLDIIINALKDQGNALQPTDSLMGDQLTAFSLKEEMNRTDSEETEDANVKEEEEETDSVSPTRQGSAEDGEIFDDDLETKEDEISGIVALIMGMVKQGEENQKEGQTDNYYATDKFISDLLSMPLNNNDDGNEGSAA